VIFPSIMSIKSFSRNGVVSDALPLLCLAGAAVALASGCSKSEAATARGSVAESVPVATGQKSETESYVAEITASGAYKAGTEGAVEVTLVPKGGYHTNAQYPYKFKVADPPADGVSYPKPLVQRADGAFEEKKGSFKIPFIAQKSGKSTVGGTLSLSVCSDANCIMDKVPLEVTVDVK
jgi:ABC-type glycerol-3-phosphate transport system substrate-binding protein